MVYLQNRSLFLDEANLARNIADRSLWGLFTPLDHQQYAPPLFLALEKLNWLLFGSAEQALRWWPLVMGCLSLYLMYRFLNEQIGKTVPAIMILWLFAFSQVYIRYSTELKQYSTDMAVSTTLIWLATALPFRKNWYYWIVIGGVAVWLSMPSVFVLAGIGMYWSYPYLKQRPDASLVKIIATSSCWLLFFGTYYWLILRHDVGRPGLVAHHQGHFWPLLPDTAEEWKRLWELSLELLGTLSGHTVPALLFGSLGLLAGIYVLYRQNRPMLLLLAAPVLLCLLASGLGKYSLMQRLSLFMMPLLGLLLALGWTSVWQQRSVWMKWLAALLFLPAFFLQKGSEYFFYPLEQEEIKPLLLELNTKLQPGDRLWIDHNAQPVFRWYLDYDPVNVDRIRQAEQFPSAWDGIAGEELPSGPVWLIFSHLVSELNRREMMEDLESMQRRFGKPKQEIRYSGVAAFRF